MSTDKITGNRHQDYEKIIRDLSNKVVTLENENSLLKNLINTLPGDIYWKNKEGTWIGLNQGCIDNLKRLGFIKTGSRSEVLGKTDYDLFNQNTATAHRKHDLAVMETKIESSEEETTQLPSGELVTLLSTKAPLWDKDGNVAGIVGNTFDISYLKKIETNLQEAKEKAEAANLAKIGFIANMSHDIRTPLTGVLGMAKMLEDLLQDPNQKQYAQWLGESGTQLLNMLNVILDSFSTDNLHGTDIYEESFNLNQLIQDLLQLERPSTLAKGIELNTRVDETIPPYLISDQTKIHRILLNLLGNAIKFTKVGQITIDVKLLKRNKTNVSVHFSVTDTGIGIPYELQNKVFDKFFRVIPSYKGVYKGNGLGLHIAQSYANLLGSEIKLISQPGLGTTFYFDLLLDIAHPTTPPVVKSSQSPTPRNTTTGVVANAPLILLVEDNKIACLTLENLITQAGCRFVSAHDGETAFNLAKTKTFDLIITDLGLPGLSGIDLTQKLREFEEEHQQKTVPIIGLTAHAEHKIKQECIKAGMNAAFTKPMNIETLEQIKVTYLSPHTTFSPKPNPLNKLGGDLPDTEKELFWLDSFPVLNTTKALKNMGHNVVLLNNIFKSMNEQEIPNDIRELQQAHSRDDWDTIENVAHRMKGGLVYCGALKLVQACQYLERYRKAGHSQLLEPLYQQLLHVMEETNNAISEWLN